MIEKKLEERSFSDVKKKREKREHKQGSETSLNDALKKGKGKEEERGGGEGGGGGEREGGELKERRRKNKKEEEW